MLHSQFAISANAIAAPTYAAVLVRTRVREEGIRSPAARVEELGELVMLMMLPS
jgi:hypothetical protein